jgi:hypothetical protein
MGTTQRTGSLTGFEALVRQPLRERIGIKVGG